jgi:E3 ubiquitin-protein ligase HUWE1
MKVDTTRVKKGTSDLPTECQALIQRLRQCNRYELMTVLAEIDSWTFGKCELYHWIDILDIFDTILAEATTVCNENELYLACDIVFNEEVSC